MTSKKNGVTRRTQVDAGRKNLLEYDPLILAMRLSILRREYDSIPVNRELWTKYRGGVGSEFLRIRGMKTMRIHPLLKRKTELLAQMVSIQIGIKLTLSDLARMPIPPEFRRH